jgi:fumarate hydratase class II
MVFRRESDSMGSIEVPADRYWGAQTQRSLENFRIGGHRFPPAVIRAFGVVKKAAALANRELGRTRRAESALIVRAADEVIAVASTTSSRWWSGRPAAAPSRT